MKKLIILASSIAVMASSALAHPCNEATGAVAVAPAAMSMTNVENERTQSNDMKMIEIY